MIIKNTLQKLEGLVRELKKSASEERLVQYSGIVILLDGLEDMANDQNCPNYKVFKQDLLTSCEVLCRLNDNNDYDEGIETGRALLAVRKMGSFSCFNVDQHYI